MIKKVEDITPLRLFDYFYTEIIGLQLNRNHEGGAVAELSKGMPRKGKNENHDSRFALHLGNCACSFRKY